MSNTFLSCRMTANFGYWKINFCETLALLWNPAHEVTSLNRLRVLAV